MRTLCTHLVGTRQRRTFATHVEALAVHKEALLSTVRGAAPPLADLPPSSQRCEAQAASSAILEPRIMREGFMRGMACNGVGQWGSGVGWDEVGSDHTSCYCRQLRASICVEMIAVTRCVRKIPDAIIRQDVPPFAANACCTCQRLGRQVAEDGSEALFIKAPNQAIPHCDVMQYGCRNVSVQAGLSLLLSLERDSGHGRTLKAHELPAQLQKSSLVLLM